MEIKKTDSKFVKKYEWMGDVKSYKEPKENEHSQKYNEPDRRYDILYSPTTEDALFIILSASALPILLRQSSKCFLSLVADNIVVTLGTGDSFTKYFLPVSD